MTSSTINYNLKTDCCYEEHNCHVDHTAVNTAAAGTVVVVAVVSVVELGDTVADMAD